MPVNPSQLIRLTDDETKMVREIVLKHGQNKGAQMLGIFSAITILKASTGLSLHKLSAITIREHLADAQKVG